MVSDSAECWLLQMMASAPAIVTPVLHQKPNRRIISTLFKILQQHNQQSNQPHFNKMIFLYQIFLGIIQFGLTPPCQTHSTAPQKNVGHRCQLLGRCRSPPWQVTQTQHRRLLKPRNAVGRASPHHAAGPCGPSGSPENRTGGNDLCIA